MAAFTGYLAAKGFLVELREELGTDAREVYGDLVLAGGPAKSVAWVSNVWHDPAQIPKSSIADAAKKLRAIQRNWVLYSFAHHCRAALIAAKLPKVSDRPLIFGTPAAPLGSWTLIAPDMVLASPSCSSPFPTARRDSLKTAPRLAAPISNSGSVYVDWCASATGRILP